MGIERFNATERLEKLAASATMGAFAPMPSWLAEAVAGGVPRSQFDVREHGLYYVSRDGETMWQVAGDGVDLAAGEPFIARPERDVLIALAEYVAEQLKAFDDDKRELPGELSPWARDHLGTCDACRTEAERLGYRLSVPPLLDESSAPKGEQLERPGGVSVHKWDHLATCDACRAREAAKGRPLPPYVGGRSAG